MADYTYIHDRSYFEQRLRPALADAWRGRSFGPCVRLDAAAMASRFAQRYHVAADSLLTLQLRADWPFDRTLWRAVAGELLLVTAVELPEPPPWPVAPPPDELTPVLRGSRDVMFGSAAYRPGRAGLNEADDTARLADWLASLDPSRFALADEDAFDAADWLLFHKQLYRRLADEGRVVVLEDVY